MKRRLDMKLKMAVLGLTFTVALASLALTTLMAVEQELSRHVKQA